MKLLKGIFGGIAWGVGIAVAVFVLATVFDAIGWFITCNTPFSKDSCVNQTVYNIIQCTNSEYDTGSAGFNALMANPDIGFWTKNTAFIIFGFCAAAGAAIGSVYGIAKQAQAIKKASIKRRAKQGDMNAQFDHGVILLGKNKEKEAKEWFHKALNQGHKGAAERINEINKKEKEALDAQNRHKEEIKREEEQIRINMENERLAKEARDKKLAEVNRIVSGHGGFKIDMNKAMDDTEKRIKDRDY